MRTGPRDRRGPVPFMAGRIEARSTTCRGCLAASAHRPSGAGGAGARRSAAKPTQAQRKSPAATWSPGEISPRCFLRSSLKPPGPGHARCPAPATSSGEIEGVGLRVEDPSHRAATHHEPRPRRIASRFRCPRAAGPRFRRPRPEPLHRNGTSRAVDGEVIWVLECGPPQWPAAPQQTTRGHPRFAPTRSTRILVPS
jgi:hypothetical protein